MKISNTLKVYDGTSFEPTGGSLASATAPSNPSVGDLWLDTTNDQVFVYVGDARAHQVNSEWELLGPMFTAGQTESGWRIENIGSAAGDKVVASMFAATTRVAIVSKEAFTPTPAVTGFATISAGITLNSTLEATPINPLLSTVNTAISPSLTVISFIRYLILLSSS